MAKWQQYLKRSITRRFSSMLFAAILLILIGAILVLWSTIRIVNDYEHNIQKIRAKEELITQIADYSNEVILRARGYFVYLTDYEFEEIFREKAKLEAALSQLGSVELTPGEEETIRGIESFFENYFDDILPVSIEYAKNEDYESLRQFISAGADNPVNTLIILSRQVEQSVQQLAAAENTKLIQRLYSQGIFFLMYILFILAIFLLLVKRLSTDIGLPLGELTQYASRFAKGETIHLQHLEREDEIGALSRSLDSMMIEIQAKEEELIAQNEELQAQQEELQAQQDELQRALAIMEDNERYLMKRNTFIQSLANTLDKQVMLQSVVDNTVLITQSDKGLIATLNAQQDYAYYGISSMAAARFMQYLDDSLIARILLTKQPYMHNRKGTAGERAYSEEEIETTELYIPILDAQDELSAVIVLTRIGKAYTQQEISEIMGITTQVSLAFDKLQMFEQHEYQRLMTRDMLNTIQEGVQFIDLEGQTLQINGKMSEIFNEFLPYHESVQLSLLQFLHIVKENVVESEALIRFITEVVSGKEHEVKSMSYEISEPYRRFVQIYYEPLFRNGVRFGILLVHRDITKEYEVDRMKSEFVSTVSHELRTPLASVLGFAELLLHRELKPDRQRKYISTIHQEAERLTTLINDFLDLQRMESGRQVYDLQLVSMSQLIQEAIELQRIGAAQHQFEADLSEESLTVYGDRDKLHQVLTNLIGNAIKYSPAGGIIRVQGRAERGRVVLKVLDEGLGIPEDALPKLFNKFYRVDNSDRREIGGTGLGLAIVKEIVNRHKGDISVTSKLGEGSCFAISLPKHEVMQEIAVTEASDVDTIQEHANTYINVMLVENDRNLSFMLRDELQSSGFRVHLFMEGRKAVEAMHMLKPDLVVLDLMLEKDTDGWAIIEAMKANDHLKNVPIIISSAFEEREKAATWGIVEFLVKPYLPGKLSATIRRILGY